MTADVVPEGSGESPASSVTIESVVLGCGHTYYPMWEQGDRTVTCVEDGSKWVVRSRRRVVVSFVVSPCSGS